MVLRKDYVECISIHAPTRGATVTRARKASVRVNFNPRSHEGSDRLPGGDAMINGISIHAPTRGATLPYKYIVLLLLHFNPRSHEGSDDAGLPA